MLEIGQTAAREIEISGDVQGDVRVVSGTKLIINKDACIHGDVHVEQGARAIIEGDIQGDVIAEGSVQITSDANVHGSIEAED